MYIIVQIKIEKIVLIHLEIQTLNLQIILIHFLLWIFILMIIIILIITQSIKIKVYLIDVVGFGKSSLPEHPLNSDDFGNFLKELLDALKIENPILIGHSNGGRIIINAVGRGIVNPRKVVLLDSAGLKPKRSAKYYVKVGIFKTGKTILKSFPPFVPKETLDSPASIK